MRQRDSNNKNGPDFDLLALYFAGAIVLVFTIGLSVNLAINGSDAVIDITPRFAEEPRKTGALLPCVVGWIVLGVMWWLRGRIKR